MVKTGIGQDSHAFESARSKKPLLLGGVVIPGCPGLKGNSDADVVLHALVNAISGISGQVVLGALTDNACKNGITDSRAYVAMAVKTLQKYRIAHVSFTLEGQRPKIAPHGMAIRESVAKLLKLPVDAVALTATSGEGLTAFGLGKGIQVFAVVTARAKAR